MNQYTTILASSLSALATGLLVHWVDNGNAMILGGAVGIGVAAFVVHVVVWVRQSKWWQSTTPPEDKP